MIGDLTGFFFALSPALAGSLTGACVALWYCRDEPGLTMLFAGVGGLLGYLAIAVLIRLLDEAGLYVFRTGLLVGLVTLVVIMAAVCCALAIKAHKVSSRNTATSGRVNVVCLLLLSLLGILLGQNIYQAAITPVASWDTLELWAGWGKRFLQFDLNLEGARLGRTRAEYGVFPWDHQRHPATVYHLSAFTGYALEQAVSIRGWLVAWSAIYLCGAAIIWGLVTSVSGFAVRGMVAAIGFCSIPLIENHSILVGYADVWMTITVVAAAAIFALALYRGSAVLMGLGVMLAIIPLGLKNTGLLYAIALLAPLLLLAGFKYSLRLSAVILCVAGAILWWRLVTGFDIEIFGQRYALMWGATDVIVFGGSKLKFVANSILNVSHNQMWALFMNQSFSVVVLLGVLMSTLLIGRHNNISENERCAVQYLLLSALILLLVFMAPQLVTRYADRYAAPGADLGNSRFIMVFGPVILLALGFLPKIAFHARPFSRAMNNR